MLRTILGVVALALAIAQADAAPGEGRLTFLGQALVEKTNTLGSQGGVIEFAPAQEPRENWTRLVGYRALPDSRQTAYERASAHAREMRERFPSERYPGSVIRAYEGRGEALAEFSIVMPDATVDYSVFRYAAGPGGHGLVSLRYSRRLRGSEINGMSTEAARWAQAVAQFDMNRVRAAVAQSRD
jgi:hypothetical protein